MVNLCKWIFFVLLWVLLLVFDVLWSGVAEGGFIGRFSLSIAEEYNDNIFFAAQKNHDFISFITPTIGIFYVPPEQSAPIFTTSLSVPGQIYLRHSNLNGFGDTLSVHTTYARRVSPKLTINLSNNLRRLGQTRTSSENNQSTFGVSNGLTPGGTPGGIQTSSLPQSAGDLISRGATLFNNFSVQGNFRLTPQVTLSGRYSLASTSFLDQGGSDLTQSINLRGMYSGWRRHNLYAAYTADRISPRDGSGNLVHNVDIGDDYFNRIEISPTLILTASTGIGINTGNSGQRVVNRLNVGLLKTWELASLNTGVQRGLTESFGLSGLSLTTTFFGEFNIRLTERLSGNARINFSMLDTDSGPSQTFQAQMGIQYWIHRWISLNAGYTHRFSDGTSGRTARINSNSAFLTLSARFDAWPNLGPSRALVGPPASSLAILRPPAP